jgi:adenylate cyclase
MHAQPERSFPAGAVEDEAARRLFGAHPVGVPASRLVARGYRDATLLFADVVNLADQAGHGRPEALLPLLDRIVDLLDRAAANHGLSRVVFSGASYAAVAGVPGLRLDHAVAGAEMALEVSRGAARLLAGNGKPVQMRIGLHSGPLVAAVDEGAGTVHEVWGESTRVARAMEARGLAGQIQVSGATAARIAPRFRLEPRRREAPAPQAMERYLLTGRLAA